MTGIDNNYHGLCVGPCDPGTAAAEAAKCPFVCEIGVTDAEDFECSYQEWVEHLRDAAHRAAAEREQSVQEVKWTGEMMKQVDVADLRAGGWNADRKTAGRLGRC